MKLRTKRLAEAGRLASHAVQHHRALDAGKYAGVYLFGQSVVVPKHEPASSAAQGFIGRRGHDIGVRQRIGIEPRCDKAGEVSHVHHEKSIDFIGDGAQAGEVDGAGIGRSSGDDQSWPMPESQIADFVEIDPLGFSVNAVGRDFVVATRQRRGMAVADVASGGDIH